VLNGGQVRAEQVTGGQGPDGQVVMDGQVVTDGQTPLVTGDTVFFRSADRAPDPQPV
jgi:hypothetical protein